jgi:hypothetical protein
MTCHYPDLLLPLHRQIFCWIDEWFPMSPEEVHKYELYVQAKSNQMGFATGGLPPAGEGGTDVIKELPSSEQYKSPMGTPKDKRKDPK